VARRPLDQRAASREAAEPAESVTSGESALPAGAAEALGPEGSLGPAPDPVGLALALARLPLRLGRRPGAVAEATGRWAQGMGAAMAATALRAAGRRVAGPVRPGPKDRRFQEPDWEENPWYFGLEQAYLLWARLVGDLLEGADLDRKERVKTELAAQMVVDALAPPNTLLGNPAALHRALQTGGLSLARGFANFLEDLATNGGRPKQVDRRGFQLGRNLAATPGQVVYRNDLMELLQYAPQTPTTFEVPLLLSPPWINRYYVMDLSPGRSFAEWAVSHGHTTFAISYRNPDASMRDVTLEDYLVHGPLQALDVVADITGAPEASIVGLCLGGTLTAMLLAYLAARGEGNRVRTATLLNTLIDFSEPGVLGAFTDPGTVARLERTMARRGYLDSAEMSSTFDLLRANDLIWPYVRHNWLMGEDPPAFDILAWNADGTRMPAAMHSFYLRACYLENRLARGTLRLAGEDLRLEDVSQEVYLLAAKEDHIAPWRSSYRATQLLARARFVLSSSGHIAGIVNPPGPKSRHWTYEGHGGESPGPEVRARQGRSGSRSPVGAGGGSGGGALPASASEWLAGAAEHQGSWWEDWAAWMATRSGELGPPPAMGSARYPPLGPAPGQYVMAP